MLTVKDGNGGITAFGYDPVGNLTFEALPGADTFNFNSYDPAHHLLQRTDANGVVTNYTYTSAGHLLWTINSPSDASVAASFGYDGYGRLTSITDAAGTRSATYDDNDIVTSETTAYTGLPARTLSYMLNPDGSRATMVAPPGTFSYDYDGVGRPASVSNPFGETTSWGYSARGDLLAQAMANGASSTYSYNALGQLTQLQNLNPSSVVLSSFGSLAYSATGNLKSTTAAIGSSSGTLSYVYDALDRLTQESSSLGSGYTLSHAYDTNSNLTTLRGGTLTYNVKGQLSVSGMTFDSNGNPTTYAGTSLTFDSDDRLTAYGSAMTAGYRSDRLRAWKQSGGTTTYFLYDGDDLLCEMDASGNVLRTYTTGADGLVSSNTASGSVFYTFDHRGATVQRLDSSGNVLTTHGSDAYGGDLSAEADPYSGFGAQFGYYHDAETGLFYLQNRYYDPVNARFLNRDPIGLSGGMNRYGYVAGNPVTSGDPSGLDPWYDQLSRFVSSKVEVAKRYYLNNTPWPVAAAINTGMEFVTGPAHLPSAIGHLGEGIGAYAGDPTSANEIAAAQDFGTFCSALLAGIEPFTGTGPTGNVEQYALVADRDGFYPVMKRCYHEPQGGIYLKKGETWKYGDTKNGPARYSESFLERFNLKFRGQFRGTRSQANTLAKLKISAYRDRYGRLPPGNKIVN